MSQLVDELLALITLEPIEVNLFRGQSVDYGWGTVYGGQVLGQALYAASQTVPEDRPVHSMHGYFLRAGDVKLPIVYDVDRIRDGGTFTTRRVVAIQKGVPIFNMAASFQTVEEGFEHQNDMPAVPPPEQTPTTAEAIEAFADKLSPGFIKRFRGERAFEARQVEPLENPLAPEKRPPYRNVWMRATAQLPDTPSLHAALIAYASDWAFMPTSLHPHGANFLTPGMQMASIDHSMWFHRPVRADEWLLYSIDSPTARGGRGLVRGQLFNRDGQLAISTAQEGLIRLRRPKDS